MDTLQNWHPGTGEFTDGASCVVVGGLPLPWNVVSAPPTGDCMPHLISKGRPVKGVGELSDEESALFDFFVCSVALPEGGLHEPVGFMQPPGKVSWRKPKGSIYRSGLFVT